jgi:hypothetical protein
MDFGIIAGVNPPDPSAESPGVPSFNAFEAARYAMGDTLYYAQKMDLINMEPRTELSSTGYVLAKPGREYLILQPSENIDEFTAILEAGTYTVEWFSINSRARKEIGQITVGSDTSRFTPPFEEEGPAVLYLKRGLLT